ncbi:MAG: cupin domain-containing protein [Chloroflexi bacterium]|nr:cupin domain-containing protein [Chloroflexota bacterium]
MTEANGKVVHYSDVPAQVFGDEAPGTTIRWLIDNKHDGAPVYALRLIEVAPGGHTPRHSHPYEHENFVIEGQGRVLLGDEWYDLKSGDAVLVPGDMQHTYENTGDVPFMFLCGIPVANENR